VRERIDTWVLTCIAREGGQTMAEYAVVLALVTVAVLVSLTALSGNMNTALNALAKLVVVR
jgi:Flp pilus assembly pilin Flp